MVGACKTRAPQTKETQPRESAGEKLDALVKDTAVKRRGSRVGCLRTYLGNKESKISSKTS